MGFYLNKTSSNTLTMKFLLCVITVLSCTILHTEASSCTAELNNLKKKYCKKSYTFLITKKEASHADAQKECQASNGELVNSDTWSPYKTQIRNVVARSGVDRLWIGLDDKAHENKFVWSNGRPYTPRARIAQPFFWAVNEPNDLNNSEDCVEIDKKLFKHATKNLNDLPCKFPLKGMCQVLHYTC